MPGRRGRIPFDSKNGIRGNQVAKVLDVFKLVHVDLIKVNVFWSVDDIDQLYFASLSMITAVLSPNFTIHARLAPWVLWQVC